jgi:hypothetical protein
LNKKYTKKHGKSAVKISCKNAIFSGRLIIKKNGKKQKKSLVDFLKNGRKL